MFLLLNVKCQIDVQLENFFVDSCKEDYVGFKIATFNLKIYGMQNNFTNHDILTRTEETPPQEWSIAYSVDLLQTKIR